MHKRFFQGLKRTVMHNSGLLPSKIQKNLIEEKLVFVKIQWGKNLRQA